QRYGGVPLLLRARKPPRKWAGAVVHVSRFSRGKQRRATVAGHHQRYQPGIVQEPVASAQAQEQPFADEKPLNLPQPGPRGRGDGNVRVQPQVESPVQVAEDPLFTEENEPPLEFLLQRLALGRRQGRVRLDLLEDLLLLPKDVLQLLHVRRRREFLQLAALGLL